MKRKNITDGDFSESLLSKLKTVLFLHQKNIKILFIIYDGCFYKIVEHFQFIYLHIPISHHRNNFSFNVLSIMFYYMLPFVDAL